MDLRALILLDACPSEGLWQEFVHKAFSIWSRLVSKRLSSTWNERGLLIARGIAAEASVCGRKLYQVHTAESCGSGISS